MTGVNQKENLKSHIQKPSQGTFPGPAHFSPQLRKVLAGGLKTYLQPHGLAGMVTGFLCF